jgi:Mg-chelatase subunit ChlI
VNAILSRHDFILLGLRGQAKTRLLRSLAQFLDEWMPAIEGCPLNSDPLRPLTHCRAPQPGRARRSHADPLDAPRRALPGEARRLRT